MESRRGALSEAQAVWSRVLDAGFNSGVAPAGKSPPLRLGHGGPEDMTAEERNYSQLFLLAQYAGGRSSRSAPRPRTLSARLGMT